MNDLNPLHAVLDHSQRLRQVVDRLGYSSPETTWRGWHVAHCFNCKQGHVISTPPSALLRANVTGCKQCAGEARLQAVHLAAQSVGATCLSTRWEGEQALYSFKCSCGHQWQRRGRHVAKSPACPLCMRRAHSHRLRLQDGMDKIRQAAAARGGECLAHVYENSAHFYPFRCAKGHEWNAQGHEVLRGSWCKRCSWLQRSEQYLMPNGLERLHAIAASHGGECLSQGAYRGVGERYGFRCKQGHEWQALGKRVVRGGWCPLCANDKKRLTLETAQADARKRGGQCLSTAYTNNSTPMEWVCHRGHFWRAALATIRSNHWCPQCAIIARITNPKSKARLRYGLAA